MADELIQEWGLMFNSFEIIVQEPCLETDRLPNSGRIIHDDSGKDDSESE